MRPSVLTMLSVLAACGNPSKGSSAAAIELQLQLAEDSWYTASPPILSAPQVTSPGILIPLNDDDSGAPSGTDNGNNRVDGATDAKQLAVLIVKKLADQKTGDKVVLRKDSGAGNIRILRKAPDGAEVFVTTSATPMGDTEAISINDDARSADVPLYIEGVTEGELELCAKRVGKKKGEACVTVTVVPKAHPIVSGDTNRDGTADATDLTNHRTWSAAAGGILYVNQDADCDTSAPRDSDDADNTICADDVDDIGRLRVDLRGVDFGSVTGWTRYLRFQESIGKEPIRVFGGTAAGATGLIRTLTSAGSGLSNVRLDLTTAIPTPALAVLGIEGRIYDQEVVVELCVAPISDPLVVSACDRTILRTNPANFQSNLEIPNRAVMSFHANSADLQNALENTLGVGNVFDTNGSAPDDVWTQDEFEIVGSNSPRGHGQCFVHLPRTYDGAVLQTWTETQARNAGVAYISVRPNVAQMKNSAEFGGNLEVLPSNGTTLGRLVVGNNMSTTLKDKLDALSGTQSPPILADVRWLMVAHVDEVMAIFPTSSGWAVAVADTQLARDIIEGNVAGVPRPDDHAALFWKCASGTDRRDPSCIAKATVASATSRTPLQNPTLTVSAGSGIDFSVGNWKWIRIYKNGTGSTARGQIARIKTRVSATEVQIDQVFNLPRVLDARCIALGTVGLPCPVSATADIRDDWISLPKAGDSIVVVEETLDALQWWKRPPAGPIVPALYTAFELRDQALNANFYTTQGLVQKRLKNTIDALIAAGVPASSIVRVPGTYIADGADEASLRLGEAFMPGMVNFQVIARSSGSHVILVAKPFGPTFGGVDPFETVMTNKVGNAPRFINDWDLYHVAYGEVHCGTNLYRANPTKWWLP